jgi:hypothetical protein
MTRRQACRRPAEGELLANRRPPAGLVLAAVIAAAFTADAMPSESVKGCLLHPEMGRARFFCGQFRNPTVLLPGRKRGVAISETTGFSSTRARF